MIVVIVTKETNPRTGREQSIVSHGVDLDTGKAVILPAEAPESIGAVLHPELGQFVLLDTPPSRSPISR